MIPNEVKFVSFTVPNSLLISLVPIEKVRTRILLAEKQIARVLGVVFYLIFLSPQPRLTLIVTWWK